MNKYFYSILSIILITNILSTRYSLTMDNSNIFKTTHIANQNYKKKECNICLEEKEPNNFESVQCCKLSLCTECLNNIQKHTQLDAVVKCPWCRRDLSIQNKNIIKGLSIQQPMVYIIINISIQKNGQIQICTNHEFHLLSILITEHIMKYVLEFHNYSNKQESEELNNKVSIRIYQENPESRPIAAISCNRDTDMPTLLATDLSRITMSLYNDIMSRH